MRKAPYRLIIRPFPCEEALAIYIGVCDLERLKVLVGSEIGAYKESIREAECD